MLVPINVKIMGKGDKVSLAGIIKYFADGSFWENKFEGETFEVDSNGSDRCCLKSPGLHDGQLYLFHSSLQGKIFKPAILSEKRYLLSKCLANLKTWLWHHWMMGFHCRLPKGFVFNVSGLWKIRKFSDGITFFEFEINSDLYKDDHNPKFRMILIVFNLKLLELEVYKASK